MVAGQNRIVSKLSEVQNRKSRAQKPAQKREQLREQIFPASAERIWTRNENDGFTTVPRLLSLVLTLIEELSPKGNPARVYSALWLRNFDEGIITIKDPEELAFESGYTGSRAVRTWREHMFSLFELGFLEYIPDGNREIGHILMLNPLQVCVDLHHRGRVSKEWWSAFARRATDIGAKLPEPKG